MTDLYNAFKSAVNNDVTPTTYHTQKQTPNMCVALSCTGYTVQYIPLYTTQHCNMQ
jgi:hypothetical protein